MVETVLAQSEALADEAFRAVRSLRGFPLCGHRELLSDGMVVLCVKARGHEDGRHD